MYRKLLAAALLLVPTAAHAEWHEASTKHFVILSDEQPERLAAFATDLERYDKAMRVFRNIADRPIAPVDRVTVYVVRNVGEIGQLGAKGAAGFYSARAGGSVAFTPKKGSGDNPGSVVREAVQSDLDPLSVLRHEYAHHFMFNNYEAAAFPLWFTEGFAEFHATAVYGEDGSITFGALPVYRGFNLAIRRGCSAKQLVRTSDLRRLNNCIASDLYAYGWLLTHYLTFTEGGPGKMASYLRALNEGRPLDQAAAAFGNLDQMEGALDKYLNQRMLPAFKVPADRLAIDAPKLRKLSEGEVATMAVRMRSKAGVDKERAPRVYEAAVRAAAPFPKDAAAQLALAEAAYDAKKYPDAEAAAGRALAADPKAVKAMVYMGMAKMAQLAAAKSADAAAWREARRWFLNANKTDPDDAEPMILYYRSFVLAGEAASKNAKDGLLGAVEYAPHDRRLRFIAAYVHLTDGRAPEARSALEPLAYDPHDRYDGKFASDLIDMIDKGQGGAAAARLAPRIKDPEYREDDGKRKS